MKFHIRTLGCKFNWLDSARISSALLSAGHQQVDQENEADYVFVNTCTVTAEADRKSHQLVNAAIKRDKQVAVMGCSPRVDASRWQASNDERTIVIDDELAFETCRKLALTEGIFAGMSSGAAVAGALQAAADMKSGTVVVVIADRGDRYLTTSLFRSTCSKCPP